MSQMDHIRKELQDYQVPVDTDKLWAATAHAIPHRRRRRGIVFWWMTGGMGVTAVMIALVSLAGGPASVRSDKPGPILPDAQPISVTRESTPSQAISSPAHAADAPVEMQGQVISSPADIADAPVEMHGQAISPSVDMADAGIEMDGQVISTRAHDAHDPAGNLPDRSATRQRILSQKPASSTNTRSGHLPEDHSIHAPETGIAASMPAGDGPQTDRPDDSPPPSTAAHPVRAAGSGAAGEPAGSIASEADIASPDAVSGQVRAALEYAALPMLPQATLTAEEVPGNPDVLALPAAVATPPAGWVRSLAKPAFFMTAVQGIGLSGLTVRSAGAEGSEEAARWAGSMRGLEYLSSHLQGGLRLPSGLMAGLGIRYGRLTTEQTFTWQVTERISGEGTSVVIIGEDGSTETVSGEVTTTRRSTFQSTRYNQHSTLDLDATIAYPVWRRPGFELLAWVRGGLNLRYDVTGTVPDAVWQPVRFDAADNPFQLTSPVSWGGGLEARVRATRHLTFHARAGYDRLQYTLPRGDTHLHFHHPLSSISLGVGYVR